MIIYNDNLFRPRAVAKQVIVVSTNLKVLLDFLILCSHQTVYLIHYDIYFNLFPTYVSWLAPDRALSFLVHVLCLSLNYWEAAESVSLPRPLSLGRPHGACMPFKMSVVKETSISVSHEHLIL